MGEKKGRTNRKEGGDKRKKTETKENKEADEGRQK